MSSQIKSEDFGSHGAMRDANFHPDTAPEPGVVPAPLKAEDVQPAPTRIIPPRRLAPGKLRKQERRERQFPHACPTCTSRFRSEALLQAQYLKHPGHWLGKRPLQPLICPTCQRRFTSEKAGKAFKTHSTEFPSHRH